MSLPVGTNPEDVDAETLIRRVIEIVGNAKSVPLSASVMVTKDEVLELLEDALEKFPDELRQARWMLKERDEFLAKVAREGDEILDAARTRAERMVERQEIVREARTTASRVVQDARDEATRLRLEAEDYCDQKLASFEIVLERTLKTARAGREKLRSAAAPADRPDLSLGDDEASTEAFFDQDIE